MKPGLDIEQIAGVDLQSITQAVQNTGQVSPDQMTITSMDMDSIKAQLEVGFNNLEAYLQDNQLDYASFTEVFGCKEIVPEYLDILPASLPYEAVVVTGETRDISSDKIDSITFAIQGADPFNLNFAGTPDFSYQALAPQLFGKRITLSWVPASSEDEAVIQAYGGIFNTPAYLVEMIPQLKIDGEVAASGDPVGLGYRQQFSMTLKGTGMNPETVSDP